MKEHMGMLEDMMSQLHKDHPGQNVSTKGHLAWMEKHDKLVDDDVLDQMIREHKLMMADNECLQ